MPKLTYTDLHVHSEFSLQDGMIRIADSKDPKHIKSEIILNAERRNTGAVTITDHGNMYGHALLASVCKTFDFKHIPACEFYIATDTRHDKSYARRSDSYMHINAWAKDSKGYSNLCILQNYAFTEGFYHVPRIDKELIQQYHDGIMWSDACVGGTICTHITAGNHDKAYEEFLWYLNLIGDDFYIEWHEHNIPDERMCNELKREWANKHGVPIIACTDAHFYQKDDKDAHKTLLCIQFNNYFDNPTFDGFAGNGYWLMDEDELIERYPIEYLNNTQLIVDKVEGGIIKFGASFQPQFQVPEDWMV